MRKIFLLSLLFVTGNLLAQSVKGLLDKAYDLRSAGKHDEAIALYDQVLRKDTINYEAYVYRGLSYYEAGKTQKAYDDYSKAISMYPDSSLAYHHRAILLYAALYTDESIYDNTKAIELAKNDTLRMIAFGNRGNAKQQKRDFQGAFEDYSRAYILDTNDISTLNNMATVLDELGRVDDAVKYLKKIIQKDSSFVGAYVNLGFQSNKQGKYKEALGYFDKALRIEKDEPLSLNNRGLTRYYLKDYDGALKDINLSISIYPGNAYAYKNRALVYLAQNKKEQACSDLQKALDNEFTKMYGNEVSDLQKKHCPGK
jgi:tetratricopeptide (TPR) repeat protein